MVGYKTRPYIFHSLLSMFNWVKGKFYRQINHEEVPESRILAPIPERIKKVVCEFYHVNKEALLFSRRGLDNEPRKVAIY